MRETRGAFIGDGRVRDQMAACERWPRGTLPADFGRLGRSDVPALLISGRYDPATPAAYGEEVAREHLPNSRHLVLAIAGPSAFEGCVDRVAAALPVEGHRVEVTDEPGPEHGDRTCLHC